MKIVSADAILNRKERRVFGYEQNVPIPVGDIPCERILEELAEDGRWFGWFGSQPALNPDANARAMENIAFGLYERKRQVAERVAAQVMIFEIEAHLGEPHDSVPELDPDL